MSSEQRIALLNSIIRDHGMYFTHDQRSAVAWAIASLYVKIKKESSDDHSRK